MLGSGFIARFYAESLHAQRRKDRVVMVYSRNKDNAKRFSDDYGLLHFSTNMNEAIAHPEVDIVLIALPNHLHEAAVMACVKANKHVICTKLLGRNAEDAKRMLDHVER